MGALHRYQRQVLRRSITSAPRNLPCLRSAYIRTALRTSCALSLDIDTVRARCSCGALVTLQNVNIVGDHLFYSDAFETNRKAYAIARGIRIDDLPDTKRSVVRASSDPLLRGVDRILRIIAIIKDHALVRNPVSA